MIESGTTNEDQFVRNVECMHRRLLGSNYSPNVCIIQDAIRAVMLSHVPVSKSTLKADESQVCIIKTSQILTASGSANS